MDDKEVNKAEVPNLEFQFPFEIAYKHKGGSTVVATPS